MSRACLESADSRCEWECGEPQFTTCRARLARRLREFAALEDPAPSAEPTARSAMISAAAELERIGRGQGRQPDPLSAVEAAARASVPWIGNDVIRERLEEALAST